MLDSGSEMKKKMEGGAIFAKAGLKMVEKVGDKRGHTLL
jgi:hypothetical protein